MARHPYEPFHRLVDCRQELGAQFGTHFSVAPCRLVQLVPGVAREPDGLVIASGSVKFVAHGLPGDVVVRFCDRLARPSLDSR